jgi:hypothetical protein
MLYIENTMLLVSVGPVTVVALALLRVTNVEVTAEVRVSDVPVNGDTLIPGMVQVGATATPPVTT